MERWRTQLKLYFKLLRPQEWVKNLFVFVGILFSRQWTYPYPLFNACWMFIAFCLAASCVYILNDYFDRHEDANHPTKCHRPLAAKKIKAANAIIFAAALSCASFLIAIMVSKLGFEIILTYIVMNLLYSFYLKHIIILDVLIISFGFILRLLAGTSAIGIEPSMWLIICAGTLTLLLGFGKRFGEKKLMDEKACRTRTVIHSYSYVLLTASIFITGISSMIAYILYTLYQYQLLHINLLYSIPWVILGIGRYIFLLFRNPKQPYFGADVTHDFFSDKILVLTALVWLIIVVISL